MTLELNKDAGLSVCIRINPWPKIFPVIIRSRSDAVSGSRGNARPRLNIDRDAAEDEEQDDPVPVEVKVRGDGDEQQRQRRKGREGLEPEQSAGKRGNEQQGLDLGDVQRPFRKARYFLGLAALKTWP